MWLIKYEDGQQVWTETQSVALQAWGDGAKTTHVVPASDLHASEELVQRLADRLAVEVREAFYFTNDSRELEETDKRSSAAVVKVMESFGLRKVGGMWEQCK